MEGEELEVGGREEGEEDEEEEILLSPGDFFVMSLFFLYLND